MSPDEPPRDAVLVPTGVEMKSYGCLRSLNRHDIDTIVASDRDWIPHFSSRYCTERAWLPAAEDDIVAYKDALLDIAVRPEVKTVVPVRECDTYVFAKYGDEFAEHVSIVSPPLDTLRKGHDRLALAREAEEAGVPYARTRLLSEVDEWGSDVVVKSRYNILTDEYVDDCAPGEADEVHSVRFVEAGDDPDAAAIREEMRHDPVVQDFIPQADKHLYCALWEDGEPLSTYQHRQIRQVSWMGGGGVYRESVHSEEVDRLAYDLLSQLDWHGFACVEYILDEETGEWKFLEINPRIWHSLPEAVRAGVDFPHHYWLAATGAPERIDAGYEPGVRCHTSYGELKHLLSILDDESPFVDPPSFARTLWQIGTSCITNPRFDYIRLDDPRFFLSAVRALSGITPDQHYETGESADGGARTGDEAVRPDDETEQPVDETQPTAGRTEQSSGDD